MDLFISAGADSVIAKPLTKAKVAAILSGGCWGYEHLPVLLLFLKNC